MEEQGVFATLPRSANLRRQKTIIRVVYGDQNHDW